MSKSPYTTTSLSVGGKFYRIILAQPATSTGAGVVSFVFVTGGVPPVSVASHMSFKIVGIFVNRACIVNLMRCMRFMLYWVSGKVDI